MKSSKNTPVMQIFIALVAMASIAGAVELAATGTNTISGNAWAEGDIFAEETPLAYYSDPGQLLYAGVWAHAYVPTGNPGINSAESERTVPARTVSKTFTNSATDGHTYDLKSNYGATTVAAKALKTGVVGLAEAFSECSSQSYAADIAYTDPSGHVGGSSQLVASATLTGTGSANASASGSTDYSIRIRTGEFGASGSVSGTAAINAANNYGGTVTGTAWIGSCSNIYSNSNTYDNSYIKNADTYSIEYISLSSSRDALSAPSTIDGAVSGQTSASELSAQYSKGKFSSSKSHTSGDLSATATTNMPGDSIIPGPIQFYYYDFPSVVPWGTQLDSEAGDMAKTSFPANMNDGPGLDLASSYLFSGTKDSIDGMSDGYSHSSNFAHVESHTSAGITRTLSDDSEAYGASYIDNGVLFATSDGRSTLGGSPISSVSAGADEIFMGSGAHLVSRLTDINPISTAELSITATNDAYAGASSWASGGSLEVKDGLFGPGRMVKTVGPSYSSGGTSADATGSYLVAANIRGTSLHTADTIYISPSNKISDEISEINIWSWIDGCDSRTHVESKYGLYPYVATPVYTSDPIRTAGTTTGPTVNHEVATTSRSVEVVFGSRIQY